jgi:hypothetical protein
MVTRPVFLSGAEGVKLGDPPNHRLKLNKRSQDLIRTHNETFSVATGVRVHYPDHLSVVHSSSRNAVSFSSAIYNELSTRWKSDSSVTFRGLRT